MDDGINGFKVAGVIPGEFMHRIRLEIMAVSKKNTVYLHEFQQAVSGVIVDEFRAICAREGVQIKLAKDVNVEFSENFYRTLHNPRQAGADRRVIILEVPKYSSQLVNLLDRKPDVFSMQLPPIGCTFVLGREAVETRRTPVRVEVNMTGFNRELEKLPRLFSRRRGSPAGRGSRPKILAGGDRAHV